MVGSGWQTQCYSSSFVMRAVLHYTPEFQTSVYFAKRAIQSFGEGWEFEVRPGYTPKTAPDVQFGNGTYLSRYESWRLSTKKACFANHLRFWEETVRSRKPAVFLEHDVVCVGPPPEVEGQFMHLSHETAKYHKNQYGLHPGFKYQMSLFKGAQTIPGTSAYLVTPEGANRLLRAYERHGADQSDVFINSMTIDIHYPESCPFVLVLNSFNSSSGRYWND